MPEGEPKKKYFIRHIKPDGRTEEDQISWPSRPIRQDQIDLLRRTVLTGINVHGVKTERVDLVYKDISGEDEEEFIIQLYP